jgi:hypothetical protein
MSSPEKKISITAIITAVISIGVVSVNLTGCSSLLKEAAKQSETVKSSAEEQMLVKASSDMNKKVPMMVDKYTRMDTTLAGPGKLLTYKYTLVETVATDIDKTKLEEIRKSLKATIVQTYKTSPAMKVFRDADVKLKYQYYDKKGAFVTDIEVDPTDIK